VRLRAYQDRQTRERFGVEIDGRLLTGRALERLGKLPKRYRQMGIDDVIRSYPKWQRKITKAVERALANGATPIPIEARKPADLLHAPGKIVCIGLNYAEHVAEGGRQAPDRPIMFAKFSNAVIADSEPIVRPDGSHALDLEVELGVVIGRVARRVARDQAMEHVAGYVVVNDVSARDWQGVPAALREGEKGDGQWLRAKGSDTFLPMGPVFVTKDEIDPKAGVRLRSWRITADGVAHPMQDGTTADMIRDVPTLIESITAAITLEPGDVIATGTPSGVGVYRDPPVFLEPGDRVRCEIDGIGSVENPVIDWSEVGAEVQPPR
jgi:2-keto-4-pentenoate hydratase/2-oxohepta-3-ene-1,7-dioic acid hydratase in catechol pathway